MNSNGGDGFLFWEERNRKQTNPVLSIQDGVAAYMNRFQVAPTVVYVHATVGVLEIKGVRVLLPPPGTLVVQRNQYAIGTKELSV
jgi:hypothetical protein